MEHTKGKWEVLDDGLTIKAVIEYKPHYDAKPPQSLIAKCFQNGNLGRSKRATKEDFANAQRIVHCVNTYDELLERIKALIKINNMIYTAQKSNIPISNEIWNDLFMVTNRAEQAIAKAKKGE